MTKRPNKLITILGPTACGKSALGIALAQEFNGEIVSADSRQIYRGLDIGTGKVTTDERALVPHHLLDVLNPGEPFSVADYQRHAFDAIDGIINRGRRPFLVGGTALYIYAVIDNYQFDNVGSNLKRRRELEKKSVEELQGIVLSSRALLSSLSSRALLSSLSSRTPAGGEGSPLAPEPGILSLDVSGDSSPVPMSIGTGLGMTENDFRNKRRLIRAIEKLEVGQTLAPKKGPPRYDNLILGIDIARDGLYARIDKRVDEWFKQGLIDEVERLRGQGVQDEWLANIGLVYRFVIEYLQNKWPSQEAMITRLKTAIHAFARRQLTWCRRDKRIHWIKDKDEARSVISTDTKK